MRARKPHNTAGHKIRTHCGPLRGPGISLGLWVGAGHDRGPAGSMGVRATMRARCITHAGH